MIPTTIKDLFKFIDFLHANIDNFNQNNELLNDLRNLAKQRSEVKKVDSFKNRIEYDKIQKQINHKFEKLKKQVNIKITAKAKQYNIIDNTQSLNVILSYNDLQQLKDKATLEDLEAINESKYKYLTYRLRTNKENYLGFAMFFNDLDRYLFELFGYFSEDKTELEILQNETIRSETIKEACLYYSKGVYPRATIRIILDSVLSKIRIKKHANKPINFNNLKTSITEAFLMAEKLQPVLTNTENKEFLDDLTNWISKTKNELKNTKNKAYLAELLKANEVDDNQKTKVKKPTKIEDFFTGIEKKQIEQLKDYSTGFNSKQSAIFIDLLYNEFKVLDVIPGNKKGKSPKDFAKLFNTETYSGLNDFFDKSKAYNGVKLVYKDQKQSEYSQMKTRLETILKRR